MSSRISTGGAVSLALLAGIAAGVIGREIVLSRQAGESVAPLVAPATEPTLAVPVVPEAEPAGAPPRRATSPDLAEQAEAMLAGRAPGARTVEQEKRAFEDRLISEPVSPSWARFNEEQVRSLFKPDDLAAEGLEVPLFHDVQCRSTLCRVNLVTRDQDTMEMTQFRVLQGISESLGTAHLFYEPQADGTVALVIYARATPR